MKRERKPRRSKSPWILLTALAVTLLLETGLGLWLRAGNTAYRDASPMAVPFLGLRARNTARSAPARKSPPAVPPVSDPQPEQTEPSSAPSTEPTLPVLVPPETRSPGASEPPVPDSTAPLAVYRQDEHYFDDALFIGDSRMESLARYARLGNADYFTDVGMTVYRMFSDSCWDDNFCTTDLAGLLSSRQYGKIYVMLGLNEAGYSLDSLTSAYEEALARLRQLQPQARIFLLKLYGVSRDQAEAASWLGPQNLDRINAMIEGLCDGDQVRCLDPRAVYEDGQGYLQEDCSDDGVHPYVKDLDAFNQWLCETAQ